jgi:DDE superfamily endonuclease
MPMPTFPLVRLAAFRAELHACFTRRADALFELGDALLCAQAVPSLPHLSLEPVHRRGWGSVYAALACGRIEVERLRDLLASSLPPADPMVFAVDVTTWPRCDAECSPERGYYYHPSRHSAGQPIVAGWAFQWIAQVSFDRDSWTAPVDARRLHPVEDTDRTAAAQIRALLARLPAGEAMPLFVFDGGYDSAQLTLDLAQQRATVLVRLRSDRCFYADPPPAARSPKGGRPRRHGAKFNCADPATWPTPTATLATTDDQYGSVTVQAWGGLHPKQQRHPGHGTGGPRPIVRGTILRVQSSASRLEHDRPRCCGCGGPARASWTWIWPGGRMSAGSTWNTPSGSPNRPSAGRPHGRAIRPGRPVDLAGAGRLHPAAPGPPGRRRSAAAVGAAPTPAATLALSGAARVSAAAVRARLTGYRTETLRMLLRPAQGPGLRARDPPPSDQEAQEQAAQDQTGCLTGPAHPPTSVDGQPSMPQGLNHKHRGQSGTGGGWGCGTAVLPVGFGR